MQTITTNHTIALSLPPFLLLHSSNLQTWTQYKPQFLLNSVLVVEIFSLMMDGGKLQDRKIGSVKAAISSYGERIHGGSSTAKKFQINYAEKSYTKTRELHQAKRDTTNFNESRNLAESETAEAESKLLAAQKTVKDLTLRIEESSSRAKSQMCDLEKVRSGRKREEQWCSAHSECTNVLKELESIKRDLSKLKLDIASIMEEKRRAENETELSMSKTGSYSNSILELSEKVEEVNEEHVLVELARIEAIKEYKEIEAQRIEMAEKYSGAIQEIQSKKQDMVREFEEANELETKLAITITDINLLKGELNQVKEIEIGDIDPDFGLLESVVKELEETKKELVLVQEESFQFMSSMDVVRNELKHVIEETGRLKTKEDKSEMEIQYLSSKLLRAKSKLETTSATEDKAKYILLNLSVTLEKLKSETETAEKERSLITEETTLSKAEVQKAETEIDLAEEKLKAAVENLKAVKSSEAIALGNLKEMIENTIRNRASASQRSSTITISKFEYEYLTSHAVEAKQIAEKKVVAAQAWVEALKASEREIQIKAELLRRKGREIRVEEERDVQKNENVVDDDFEKWRQKRKPEIVLPSKAVNRSFKYTPARRANGRKSGSPLIRGISGATSSTTRRKRRGMSNLAQLFSGKGNDKDL